jgi:hypothetical protein
MNPLESRKKLLIAESELNRAQLIQDWRTMAGEVHSLASQARTIRSVATATVSLVAGLASFRRKPPAPAEEKPSWLKTIFKGAQLAASLWTEFHTRPKS